MSEKKRRKIAMILSIILVGTLLVTALAEFLFF